jgi:hypothetical protein
MPRSSLTALGAVAAVILAAAPAAAQTAAVQAEQLFREGRDAMKAGRFAEACEAFAESQKLDPSAGTLLNLADCREKNNQLASAWVAYIEAQGMLRSSTDAQSVKMVGIAQKRAKALEGRISKLVVEVPASSRRDGLAVTRNGEPLSQALWGRPSPVDGGTVVVEVTAPGALPWRAEVEVATEGDVQTIEVPALEDAPRAAEPDRTAAATPPDDDGAADDDDEDAEVEAEATRPAGPRRVSVQGGLGMLFAGNCEFCSVGFALNASAFVELTRNDAFSVQAGGHLSFATDSGDNDLYLRTLNVAGALRVVRLVDSMRFYGQAGLGFDWVDVGQSGSDIGTSEVSLGSFLAGIGFETSFTPSLVIGGLAGWESIPASDDLRIDQFTIVFTAGTVL